MNNISSSLASRVRDIILATFDTSDQEALDHAIALVNLSEGWGGQGAANLDWVYRVKKELGKKMKWRSDVDRHEFESDTRLRHDRYEDLVRKQKRT
ncbi:MAG: hypothetical protein IT577_10120 [Verrucomicrobiae bacterium]|nr:hypothetical protein [Verrucomicrobiae bacterium]